MPQSAALSYYINSNYAAITGNCIRYLNIVLGFKWQHAEKAFGKKKKTCPVCIKCGIKLNERPDQKTSPEPRSRTSHSLTPPPLPPLLHPSHNCPHRRSPQHRTQTKSWNRSRIRNWNQSNWLNAWQNFYRIPFPPVSRRWQWQLKKIEKNWQRDCGKCGKWQAASGRREAGGMRQMATRISHANSRVRTLNIISLKQRTLKIVREMPRGLGLSRCALSLIPCSLFLSHSIFPSLSVSVGHISSLPFRDFGALTSIYRCHLCPFFDYRINCGS